ncbi:MAG: hypothetical protein ACREMH_03535 [Gemmatimonadales bacterium]
MDIAADSVLAGLEEALRRGPAAAAVQSALGRVLAELAASGRQMEWEILPLEVFGGTLPGTIRSCWVFAIRAGAETTPERHPNSHQRSLSLSGGGIFEIRARGWLVHPLVSEPEGASERRWVSIPPATWHRLRAGTAPWGMVSFHTVPPPDLVEEKPVDPADLDGPTRGETYTGRR